MTLRDPFTIALDAPALGRWGHRLLVAGYAAALAFSLFAVWKAPTLLAGLIGLPLLAAVVIGLYRHPLLNLVVVLSGFALVLERTEGFVLAEAVFGLYFASYLAIWYATRLLVYRERFAFTVADKALVVFFGSVFFSVPVGIFFGGSLSQIISELVALSVMGFYFPIREACVRYRRGIYIVLAVLLGLAAYAAFRNANILRAGINDAEFAWQIATGRVVTNDFILMTTSVLTLVLTLFARSRKAFSMWLGAFFVLFGGLLITQSRGYWISFAFAAVVLFVIIPKRYRWRLITLGGVGLFAVVLIGMVLFADVFELIWIGLVNRLFSVGTAVTADLSLVNRWAETATVWEAVRVNPILGHGPGVPYYFYDMAESITHVDTFVHNGYLGIWYKYGMVGLLAMATFLLGSIVRGVQLFRKHTAPLLARTIGLGTALAIVGTLPATVTNNPLFLIDSLFMLSAIAGLGAGAHAWAMQRASSVEGA